MKLTVRFHDHTQDSLMRIFSENGIPSVVVELGCFEGDTTFNVARFLESQKPYAYYAVDPFMASENLRQEVVDEAKERFLQNAAEYPRVELIEKKSFDALLELHARQVKADLIYVDGSHFAADVLADAVLGFEMLNPGGVMLFDDAMSWRYGEQIQDSPKIAIDNFIQCNWHRLKVLEMPNGYQVAIKKN
jgi:hypothetical protein